jgi:hypothetical protein
MNWVDTLTKFLLDENRRLPFKVAIVVSIFVGIILIDNVLGFSYYYNTEKKIEQVEKLNSLLNDSLTDKASKTFALKLRKEVMENENWIKQSFSLFTNILEQNKSQELNPQISNNNEIRLEKNNFWFTLSSSGSLYLALVVAIPLIIFTDKKTSIIQRLSTSLLVFLIFIMLALFFNWICSFIPQISNTTWLWNYILNSMIQMIQIFFIWIIVKTGNTKK